MPNTIEIPTPIAPARPIQSPIRSTTPATFGDGSTGVIDSQGNIWKGGTMVQPGAGNVGDKSTLSKIWDAVTIPSFPSIMTPQAQADANAAAAGATDVVKDAATRTVFGISLVDGVAILLGIVCIIGGLYTFSATKTVITTAAKGAKAAAEAAAI